MKTAIALAVLTLTGCTVERTIVQEPMPTSAVETSTPRFEPEVLQTDEDGYIEFIESQVGPVYLSRYDLLETGYLVCDSARSGTTMEEFVEMILASTDDEAGQDLLMTATASALAFLCPGVMPDGSF